MAPNIIINSEERKREIAARVAAENEFIPLRILCPGCKKIFTIFIKDFDQGLHCILGQACPACNRFITEKDDPEKLLVDLKEIRAAAKNEKNKGV